ncbi:MAG: heparinase II/III family protein [Pseudomonadota bacterium]
MALADSHRLMGFAIAESWRGLRRKLVGGRPGAVRISGPSPERLVLAPPDLHTADPTVAQDIYSGVYNFAGRTAFARGTNPFTIDPPSEAWARELNSFTWLRHLGAAGDAVSATNAQFLARDWIYAHRNPAGDPAWDVDVTAQRLLSWLCHSVLIVRNAELDDYRRFLKSIGQHVRFLRASASGATDGMPRLTARIALAYAAICVEGRKFSVRSASRDLDAELSRQIYPDGGHISRCPGVLPEILALLLPLRESILRTGKEPSHELLSAIDKVSAALKFYRMGDGSIARFNGTSATSNDLVATVLRYDQTMGEAPANAAYSGFHRILQDQTMIIFEAGKAPRGDLSANMHAGCLSFELSSAGTPVIVNCGIPPFHNIDAIRAGRSTAAHSTLTLNDTSSCRFNADSMLGRYFGDRIISGPSRVPCERKDAGNTVSLTASHDGYLTRYGVIHERMLVLGKQGCSFMGIDRIKTSDGRIMKNAGNQSVAIRFHLHPSVSASKMQDGRTIHLSCARGQSWRFVCTDTAPQIEESMLFAVPGGSRRTSQIVLNVPGTRAQEVRWLFERQDNQAG